MRFHGRREEVKTKDIPKKVSFVRAFQEMHKTRMRDKRPFGEVLGDAVLNSIKTLVMVGGFIVLFSVLVKLLFLVGITDLVARFFEMLLSIFSFSSDFAIPLFSGLFEITIGANMISQLSSDSLLQKAIIISFILGFNGFSVQAQVASILAKTDIRFTPYFFSRLLHGIIASLLTLFLYKPLYLDRQVLDFGDVPVHAAPSTDIWTNILLLLKDSGALITLIFLLLAIILQYRRLN